MRCKREEMIRHGEKVPCFEYGLQLMNLLVNMSRRKSLIRTTKNPGNFLECVQQSQLSKGKISRLTAKSTNSISESDSNEVSQCTCHPLCETCIICFLYAFVVNTRNFC